MRFFTLTVLVAPIAAQQGELKTKVCNDLCAKISSDVECFTEAEKEKVGKCPEDVKFFHSCKCNGGDPYYWWSEKDEERYWCAKKPAASKCYWRGNMGHATSTTKNPTATKGRSPGYDLDSATRKRVCNSLCNQGLNSCISETDKAKVGSCSQNPYYYQKCQCSGRGVVWWVELHDETRWCSSGVKRSEPESKCYWRGKMGHATSTTKNPTATKGELPGSDLDSATRKRVCNSLCNQGLNSCIPETDKAKVGSCSQNPYYYQKCQCSGSEVVWWVELHDESRWCSEGVKRSEPESKCYWRGNMGHATSTTKNPTWTARNPGGDKDAESSVKNKGESATEKENNSLAFGIVVVVVVVALVAVVVLALIAFACCRKSEIKTRNCDSGRKE